MWAVALPFTFYCAIKIPIAVTGWRLLRAERAKSDRLTLLARAVVVLITVGSAVDDLRHAFGALAEGSEQWWMTPYSVLMYFLHCMLLGSLMFAPLDLTLRAVPAHKGRQRPALRRAVTIATICTVAAFAIAGTFEFAGVVRNMGFETRYGVTVARPPRDRSLTFIEFFSKLCPQVLGGYCVLAGACFWWRTRWPGMFAAMLAVLLGMGAGGPFPALGFYTANFWEGVNTGGLLLTDLRLTGRHPRVLLRFWEPLEPADRAVPLVGDGEEYHAF